MIRLRPAWLANMAPLQVCRSCGRRASLSRDRGWAAAQEMFTRSVAVPGARRERTERFISEQLAARRAADDAEHESGFFIDRDYIADSSSKHRR